MSSRKLPIYVRVSEEDLPPGSAPHVLVPVVDLQRLTEKVVSAKNAMGELKKPLRNLTTTAELSQKGVTQVAQDVSKKLNLAAAETKKTAGKTGVKAKQAVTVQPPAENTYQPRKKRTKRPRVTSRSGSEEDSGSDASEMERDRKRKKGQRLSESDSSNGEHRMDYVPPTDDDDDDGNGDKQEENESNDGDAEVPADNDSETDDDLYVDYEAKPALAKHNRVVRPVVHPSEGNVGVCVLWDIRSCDSVYFDKAIQNAAVDKQLRSYGMASMEKLWHKDNSTFAEFFEEVVNGTVTGLLREVVKAEGKPVFVRHNLVLRMEPNDTDDQFIQHQPQPVRSALIYARNTFFDFTHEESKRLELLVRAVGFVKGYLDSIRRGYPELKASAHSIEEDD